MKVMHLLLLLQLWTSLPDASALLHGSWQSCVGGGEDTSYAERVYDRYEQGKWKWSLHLGPYHEFALFTPAHEPTEIDHTHSSSFNLLSPDFEVRPEFNRGQRTWSIPSLKLWINIILAGGSRAECESFVILVRRTS